MPATGERSAIHRAADWLDRATGWLDRVVQYCLVGLLGAIFALMMTQVLLRYVIYSPVIWIEEAAAFLLPVLAVWGTATCFRRDQHLSVTFILDSLPDVVRRVVLLAIYALVLYFAWKITSSSYALAELGRTERATSGAFSLYWPRIAIVAGGILIMIQVANLVVREALGRPASPPGNAADQAPADTNAGISSP